MAIARDGSFYAALSSLRRNSIRVAKRLKRVHPTTYVHRSASVSRDLETEEWVFIGAGVHLDPRVRIGRYTMLASEVCIVGDDHIFDVVGQPMQFTGRPPQQETVIGRDVWLGRRALIRRGVTVGNGAIVGAGAIVTSDVAPYAVVAGIPARVIRSRFDTLEHQQDHEAMLSGPVVERVVAQSLNRSAHA